MNKLEFSYNAEHDIITIEGINYSGEMFRAFGSIKLNTPFQIISRENGSITVQQLPQKENVIE